MDLNSVRLALEPFVGLMLYIVVSGVGVSAITQLLKDRRIPVPASKYPRTVSAVGAVLATLVSLYVGDVNLLLNSTWDYIGLVIAILAASAWSYNILFRGLAQTGTLPPDPER